MISNETQKRERKPVKNAPPTKVHDHTPQLKRLSRIKGQVEGVERMIVDQRYCPEIVMQIKAVRSALKSLESTVIEGHMRHCVKEAIASRDAFIVQEKIEEIIKLLNSQN